MSRFALFQRGFARLSLFVIVALALVLVALPTAAMAAPVEGNYGYSQPSCGDCYVVKKGDTLSQIAKSHGVNTHELARYNGISNPSLIYVGQHLRIPRGGHHGGCGDCGYEKPKHDDCYDCGYEKPKHNDCYDCGYEKPKHDDCYDCDKEYHHKDYGCGCDESYSSYSGYLYGSHLESYTLTDEYSYGYSYYGYDHSR